MSNKNEKKSNVWLWILAVLVLIALVVVLILHPWNRSEGDAADTPAVTATAAPAETGTVESNSSLGEADQAAAEAATGEQQSTTIEDKSGLIESIRTALKVIKEAMDKSRADGYTACDLYVYQANNCMAFLWMEFNPQYISLFDAQGNAGDTVVLTEEQVKALGATIPEF